MPYPLQSESALPEFEGLAVVRLSPFDVPFVGQDGVKVGRVPETHSQEVETALEHISALWPVDCYFPPELFRIWSSKLPNTGERETVEELVMNDPVRRSISSEFDLGGIRREDS